MLLPRARSCLTLILALLAGSAAPARAVFLIGDSITYPIVPDGGPGYPELIPDADWLGCIGGAAFQLDSPKCGVLMPTIEGSYLWDVVIPAASSHRVATLLYGTNDFYWNGEGIPDADFVADILHIANALHDSGVERVVFLGPPDRATDLPGPVIPYYAAMLPVCDAIAWLECGPNFQAVIGPEHYDEDDILHPNTRGAAAMAETLLAYLPEPGASRLSPAAICALAVLRRARARRRHGAAAGPRADHAR